MWHCGLYKVSDPEGHEVFMPLSDWLKRRGVDQHDTAAEQAIRVAYLAFALRRYAGERIDPAGLKNFSFDRQRNAKLSDLFKSITHKQLAP